MSHYKRGNETIPPKKFSDETCQCLIENYSKGLPLKYCADIAGIDRRTVHRWMEKGRESKRGKYRDFYIDMQKAKSKFVSKHIQKIQDNKSWMSSQYLLQVTDPDEFVVAEKQKIESETKATIQAEVDMNDPRIREADLQMLKELIGDKDADNSGADKPTT